MWSIARRSILTIAQLDSLFTLPSVSSIISHPQLLLFVEVPFLIVVILALPLIPIFAPAAMVTSLPNSTTTNVSVPTIDLQQMPFPGIADSDFCISYPNGTIYCPPSAAWVISAQTAMEALAPVSWPAPPPNGCSGRCNYTITYAAPTLTCLDLRTDQIWVEGSSSSIPPPGTLIILNFGFVYNATAVNGTMNLAWREYEYTPRQILLAQPQGVTCTFFNATYRASISYLNGSQSLWTEAISTGERIPMSSGDFALMQNSAFVDAFVSSFNTTLALYDASVQRNPPYSSSRNLRSLYAQVFRVQARA
jgi:hypothetical protein